MHFLFYFLKRKNFKSLLSQYGLWTGSTGGQEFVRNPDSRASPTPLTRTLLPD